MALVGHEMGFGAPRGHFASLVRLTPKYPAPRVPGAHKRGILGYRESESVCWCVSTCERVTIERARAARAPSRRSQVSARGAGARARRGAARRGSGLSRGQRTSDSEHQYFLQTFYTLYIVESSSITIIN